MKSYLLILVLICSAVWANAETMDAQLQAANEAYKNDEFSVAIEQYEAILDAGYESEVVFYNLGNSYYREGKIGPAILNYEKALKLAPQDEDVRHNLKVANRSLLDNLDSLPQFFLSRWWNTLRLGMSATAWSILGLVFLWLGIGGLVLWIWGNSRARKKQGFVLGIVALLLCILPFSLANSRVAYERHSGGGILMVEETALRSAPDAKSTDILVIHEGLKVELLDEIGEWYKVRLSNGEQGWLPKEVVAEI
jgi:tetratricopeptide (TPR) repeat protein